MKKCLNCDNNTSNPKFCSKSCSATYTNKNKVKSQETKDKISSKLKEYVRDKPKKSPGLEKMMEVRALFLEEQRKRPFDELSLDGKRVRILEEQNNSCLMCGLSEWLGKPIKLELDHINGDNKLNERDNLRFLCPNCHSQTPTWRRNKKSLEKTDDMLYEAYLKCGSASKALRSLNMATKKETYLRMYKVIEERENKKY